MSKYTGKYRKRQPKETEQELEIYRSQPHREEELHIEDYVVCRECGRRMQYVGVAHLRFHKLSVGAYREKWSFPSTYCPLAKAKRLKSQRSWVSRQNPEDLKEYKRQEYLAHREERIAASTQRNIDHKEEHHQAQARYRASERGQELARRRKKIWQAKVRKALDAANRAKRPATKAAIFAQAHKLRQEGQLWSKIAKTLVPDEYKLDVQATIHRLKEGVRYHRNR